MDFANGSPMGKNPRRVAAGKINDRLRRPWAPEDRQRQRQNCRHLEPWQFSTGPRTTAGKKRAAANGRRNQLKPGSLRHCRASVADVGSLVGQMADLRKSLGLP